MTLPPSTTVNVGLMALSRSGVWLNSNANFNVPIAVVWKDLSRHRSYNGAVKCMFQTYIREGVPSNLACSFKTPLEPGAYSLVCNAPPAWLRPFTIPLEVKDARSTQIYRSQLSFIGPLETTHVGAPVRARLRIVNNGSATLFNDVQIRLDFASALSAITNHQVKGIRDVFNSVFKRSGAVSIETDWLDSEGRELKATIPKSISLSETLYPGATMETMISTDAPPTEGTYKLRVRLALQAQRTTNSEGKTEIKTQSLAMAIKDANLRVLKVDESLAP